MVKIFIATESRFPINRRSIKMAVEKVLKEKNIRVNVTVEVNIVGDRKMRFLNKTYRNIDQATNVLSFPLENSYDDEKKSIGFVNPPDGILRLGSIVVSFPQAVLEAAGENCLVDERIAFLVEHGMMHLLGYHHDDN